MLVNITPHRSSILTTACKNITTLICSACFLATSSLASAEQNDIRVDEGPTSPQHQIGIDAWSAAPRSAKVLADASDKSADTSTAEPRHILWFGNDFWITDIGTLLYKDADRDGYFSGFSLTIDADTQYSHAEVYAAIDIQFPDGARERLHTTGIYHLYGNSITDEYRIDIELVENYPIGQYNLFVDLVDAYDHRVVDQVDASEFSNLAGLPLESEDLDYQPVIHNPVAPSPPATTNNTNIRVAEYSGALNFWVILGFAISILVRTRRSSAKFAADNSNK